MAKEYIGPVDAAMAQRRLRRVCQPSLSLALQVDITAIIIIGAGNVAHDS